MAHDEMISKAKKFSAPVKTRFIPRPQGTAAKTAWPVNSLVQFRPNGHVSCVNNNGFLKWHSQFWAVKDDFHL
jgi:hypothetical protein